jgi:hypothetical protein
MAFNQTGRTLHNPGLFGVPQKLRRALGRNSACLIVPRRATGCFHQRNRAIKSLAGREVGLLFHEVKHLVFDDLLGSRVYSPTTSGARLRARPWSATFAQFPSFVA